MVDTQLLERIDSLELSERAKSLREQYFSCKPGVGGERARLTVEAWKETEGEPIDLRRAKLLRKVLEEVPVVIWPGQLLVGSETKYFRGSYPHCDYDGSYLIPLLEEQQGEVTMGGPVERGIVTEDDYKSLIEAVGFWRGKTAREKAGEAATAVFGSWYDDLVDATTTRYEAFPQMALNIRWDYVLERGFRGLIKEAEEHIRQWKDSRDNDVDKLHFWQSTIIVLEAAISFAHRYAAHARQMAAAEPDAGWRAELERIAESCDWVPENPPRTFREVLQALVLVRLATGLDNPISGGPGGWGNLDQHLYPYFKRDMDEGRLTLQEAADLVGDLLIFSGRLEFVMDLSWRDYMQKGFLESIGLGGPDKNGNDVSNELSYLILHVMGLMKLAEPHIVIRWHRAIPRWLMRKAMETNYKVGGGVPQFQNAEHLVDYFVQRGVSLENARGFQTHGCSQAEPLDQPTTMQPSYLNVPIAVDLALHNGIASKTGKRLGLETGDPRNFATFEDFYDAFKKQLTYVFQRQLWHDRLVDQVRGQHFRQPLASALMPGCMEKGKDFGLGGLPHYALSLKKDRGIIPAADSLTAIKKLVYDEKRVSIGEILDAVDSNFEGERGEEIRQMCLAAPKYGNDNDEADGMVRDVGKFSAGVIFAEKNIFGWPYAINRNGQAWHWMAGKKLAALPNGRRAGEPLADGSLSATQGMDRNGPTALLNSALKADFKEAIAGILNIKLSAPLLQTAELRDKVITLTESFLKRGGTYIQYNILDAKVLMEAKRNPEAYKDLVVRVGGYSAYFVNLSPEIQDEIIHRTEHSLVGS